MQGLPLNHHFKEHVGSFGANLSSDSTKWMSSLLSCQSKKDG